MQFRPLGWGNELSPRDNPDQATLEAPIATPQLMRNRGEFLVATTKLPVQDQGGQNGDGYQANHNGHLDRERDVRDRPTIVTQVQPRPTRLFKSSLTERNEGVQPGAASTRVPAFKADQRMEHQRQFAPASALRRKEIALLDTLKPLPPADLDTRRIAAIGDDPQFAKLSTIPMMALTSATTKLGASQKVMKTEVSGAAGAAGIVGFGNIVGSMLKYVSTFLIQYGFGAGGYGLYTLCLSLVNLVSAIFNLGLDDAMVRYVAIYRGKQQTKSLQGLLLFCTALAGIAGLLGALLLLFFTPQLVTLWLSLKHHTLDNAATLARAIALLQVMAPVIPLMTMQVMWFAGLRGFKAFKWRVLSTSVLQPLLQILLMLGVIYLFRHDKDGITAVALVLLISTMFSAVLNMFFLLRQVSRVATPEPERYEVREWLTFASFNFLTTIIDTVLDSIDTILLAVFGVSVVAIGQYGAAIRLSAFIAMPLLSLNNIFAPTIAELHSQGEMKRLESMFKIMTKWSISFSLPIFLVMVLFSPFLLAIPGASFAPAWPLLIAFSVGAMINAGTGAVGYMLLMTGYQRLSFLNSLVAVAVNIGLGIWLTPRYGAMGTAMSTGLAICALNLMRMLQVRVLLKMHPYRLDTLKPVAAGLISSVLTGILLYLIYREGLGVFLVIGHAILSVQLLLIPVFLALYIWFLALFGGSPEDEIVLKAIRKKFLRGKGKKKKNMNNVKEA